MFEERVEMIERGKVNVRCSPWGNTFSIITEEQIKELHKGKVIYVNDGEYGHFIRLEKGE